MAPKAEVSVESLIAALSNQKVIEALSKSFQPVIQAAIDNALQKFNTELKKRDELISKLQQDILVAENKIDSLEGYNRRDNLLISGLPVTSFAEAASVASTRNNELESSAQTEVAVLELFNQQLGVPIVKQDISIAHRLKPNRQGPPVVIVRFTSRRARESVFAARRQLRNNRTPIYINEDLSKKTAELFKQTRQMVKAKRIHSTWTHGGTVYVKVSGEPSCKPKRLDDIRELSTLD